MIIVSEEMIQDAIKEFYKNDCKISCLSCDEVQSCWDKTNEILDGLYEESLGW